MAELIDKAASVIEAMGFDYNERQKSTLAFSNKPSSADWQAFLFKTDSDILVYHLVTNENSVSKIRTFLSGIKKSTWITLATLQGHNSLFIYDSTNKKILHFPLKTDDDYSKIINALRKYNINTDSLTGKTNLNAIIEDLFHSSADYTNRGLFSNHYLETRMFKKLKSRRRFIDKECNQLFPVLESEDKNDLTRAKLIIQKLGYDITRGDSKLYLQIKNQSAITILTKEDEFDIKNNDSVPSMGAVAALNESEWVILTNGTLWRMYSSKVSSASTNYFEINLQGIVDKQDRRLQYFVAIFGAQARILDSEGKSDLDSIYEGGVEYANELEQDMKNKIFEGKLFIKLVKGILDYSSTIEYQPEQLLKAKRLSIKLLYRIMFIMYAESRLLLPIEDNTYKNISLSSIHDRIISFTKNAESTQCWLNLQVLFRGIREGNPEANLPRYNGGLFEFEPDLDGLEIKNKFLASVIQDMTEKDGKRIDYQNLGVRHLGSIYEGLLEYDIKQAEKNMIITKKGTFVDAKFADDMTDKPRGFLKQNELYLSSGGLARKGTGSYFTPEPIVQYLVHEGLQHIFTEREKEYDSLMEHQYSKTMEFKNKCDKIMLDLKILDPAMGSGHFLVIAADEVTRWIMRLIEKHPKSPIVETIKAERTRILNEQEKSKIRLNKDLLTSNTILKRLVIKRCIFGVDSNKLASELAKLSLWLDSFTIGVPLTFFDHHIRHGNSLIGLGRTDGNVDVNASLDDYTSHLQKSSEIVTNISRRPDTTFSEIKRDLNDLTKFRLMVAPKKQSYDIHCTEFISGSKSKKKKTHDELLQLAEQHHTFHWELEFPEVFANRGEGFHLVIGNPPWEAIKPNDDEFFSRYRDDFRAITNKKEKQKIMKELLKDRAIKAAFDDYVEHIRGQSRFYKESKQYNKRGKGDTDAWKLFLERMLSVMADGGTLSVVLPSGILTNEGATPLRKELLNMEIINLIEFENRKKIFGEVHRSYKFVLLVVKKCKPKRTFDAAFYLHNLASLKGNTERKKRISIPLDLISQISPKFMAIPEFRTEQDVKIMSAVYSAHGRVGGGLDNGRYTIEIVRELDRTNDSGLFEDDGMGWPLVEGKNFHQFLPDYSEPEFTVLENEGLERVSRIKAYEGKNREIHEKCRLAYRAVASATNMRTMISCIVPPHRFFAHSTFVIVPQYVQKPVLTSAYYSIILYLTSIFNSMTFDYILRIQTSMNLSSFLVYNIAIPQNITNNLAEQIIGISTKLTLSNKKFSSMADALDSSIKPLPLSKTIELMAELDALVACHYGLNRDQYVHILSTFNFKEMTLNTTPKKWDASSLHAIQYAIKKGALKYYDQITASREAKHRR